MRTEFQSSWHYFVLHPCQTRKPMITTPNHIQLHKRLSSAVSLWLLTSLSMRSSVFILCFFTNASPTVIYKRNRSSQINTVFTDLQNCPRRLSLILGNKKVYSLGFICTTSSQVRTNEIGLHIVDNHFSGCPSKILFWSRLDYISYRDWDGNLDSVFRVVLE